MHHNLIVEAMQREEGEEAKHTAAAWMEDIIDAFGLWRVLMGVSEWKDQMLTNHHS